MKKITITFKDPDGVSNGIQEAVAAELDLALTDEDEREAVGEIRTEKVAQALRKWIRWGEYLTVEFDLEAKTATVIEQR